MPRQDSNREQPGKDGRATRSHPQGDDITCWTTDDEERSIVQNRGFAVDKYRRGSQLGSGGWSIVHKTLRVADGRVFAGKSSEAIQEMRNEATILRSLQHEQILKFIDWHEEPDAPGATLLVTELCGHGSLQTRIDHASPNMDRSEILQVVKQMGEALEYLHHQRLFHTDIKPRNILVRGLRPMDVVLADCADVKKVGTKCPLRGTLQYYSPEILQHGRHYDTGDDVWALGITLLGMVAQWPPLGRTREEFRKYPHRCNNHVQKLIALNPRHGIVRLLAGMVTWELDERASPRECANLAAELLGGERRGESSPQYDLGIEVPEDFRPISFW